MNRSSAAAASAAIPSAEDERRMVEELRGLKSQHGPRQTRIAKAIKILNETASARVRNAAALALADLRAANSSDELINLLARSDTKGSRGTILYALDQLRAEVPLPILASIIAEDSYEAREEALALITRGRFEPSAEEFAMAEATLEAARVSPDPERAHAIERALKYVRTKRR